VASRIGTLITKKLPLARMSEQEGWKSDYIHSNEGNSATFPEIIGRPETKCLPLIIVTE
jgi:hypothetical protein